MNNTYDYITQRPSEFRQLAVDDLLFLHYKCPQVDKYIHIYNHFNQIAFTLQGLKVFHHGTKTWQMTEHNTHFAKKGAWRQENADLKWELIAFYFPDEFLSRFYTENSQLFPKHAVSDPSKDLIIEINIDAATRAFFYSVLPYFTQLSPPTASLLQLKFKELLLNILANPQNEDFLCYAEYISRFQISPLHDVMEANFYYNLSIPEFARIAQRSVSSFKRAFQEHYHTTPGKWLAEKRLNYAKHLLETSTKNVNEIAYDSGFENVSHFSRVFKEKYGTAPLQYRKQHV